MYVLSIWVDYPWPGPGICTTCYLVDQCTRLLVFITPFSLTAWMCFISLFFLKYSAQCGPNMAICFECIFFNVILKCDCSNRDLANGEPPYGETSEGSYSPTILFTGIWHLQKLFTARPDELIYTQIAQMSSISFSSMSQQIISLSIDRKRAITECYIHRWHIARWHGY